MIVKLIFFAALVAVCYASDDHSKNLVKIPLVRMESVLQRMARENIHPRVIESFFARAAKAGNGTAPVPLFKFLDNEFYGEVLIGHPGQKFKVIFDTAWPNSWVPSVLCPVIEPGCALRARYDSSRSSTYIKNNKPFEVKMGSLSLKGKLSTDLFHVGQVNVTNQTFAEIIDVPWTLFFSIADGVFGLAFSDYSVDGVVPVFYNMWKQQVIDQKIFSFYMNRDPASKKGGTIMFGGVEPRHYLGNFTDVKIVPKTGLWTFKIDSINTTKPQSPVFCANGCLAYADTSDNTIRGPANDIEMINQIIGAKSFYFGRFFVPCSTAALLPKVNFVLKGKTFTLKPRDYVQKMTWGPVTVCLSSFKRSENPNDTVWALGGAFLSRYYVKFDMEKMVIGFADARL